MSRYHKGFECLAQIKPQLRAAQNDRLLEFTKPPSGRNRKPQSQQVAEIQEQAKRISPAREGDQFNLPIPRLRKLSAPVEKSEDDLHINVVAWLRANGVFFWHTPNALIGEDPRTAKFHKIQRAQWKRGVLAGVSDILIYEDRLYALELKSPSRGGTVSDEQEEFFRLVTARGGFALASNDWHEIMAWFKQHGIGRHG